MCLSRIGIISGIRARTIGHQWKELSDGFRATWSGLMKSLTACFTSIRNRQLSQPTVKCARQFGGTTRGSARVASPHALRLVRGEYHHRQLPQGVKGVKRWKKQTISTVEAVASWFTTRQPIPSFSSSRIADGIRQLKRFATSAIVGSRSFSIPTWIGSWIGRWLTTWASSSSRANPRSTPTSMRSFTSSIQVFPKRGR